MIEPQHLSTEFGRLYLRMHRLLDRRMAEGGASLARTKLLLCLRKLGPSRNSDIADLLDLAPRTVTEGIDSLERDGLVLRGPDPVDRRAKLVSLTAEGSKAIATTEPLRTEFVERIFGALSAEQRLQFDTIIVCLLEAIDREEG